MAGILVHGCSLSARCALLLATAMVVASEPAVVTDAVSDKCSAALRKYLLCGAVSGFSPYATRSSSSQAAGACEFCWVARTIRDYAQNDA
mmetsp:Transcript_59043/g.171245  ORF Transcript_59043/g.171245 Transcript_59043/m.171245 type:complete len:90 (-) Transcript_59043:13-282(-)